MDSMRHLSTSLPHASRQRAEADLISSFKAAALSVTNLYKSAQSEKIQAREAGYQDALEDLLEFLDKENIGLGDGEGWNVRRWIQSRLEDSSSPRQGTSEDEEDATKTEEVETRQSSPEVKKTGTIRESSDVSEPTEPSSASEPAIITQDLATPSIPPSMHDFSFRAAAQLPTNHDREGNQMDLDGSTTTVHRTRHNKAKTNTVRRDVRLSSPAISLNMTSGAGSKRKLPYSDFFDIGNLNFDTDRKDNNSRGGKRGRHV